MTPLLEEEEASLHERLLKERTNIQCREVHGKSEGKGIPEDDKRNVSRRAVS